MIIVIGEILIDRFPDYERIGGAPFNFAYHIKQMGFPVRFISRIGEDAAGRKISQLIETSGFSTEDLQIDPQHATGRVDVILDPQGVPQFDIRENVAYDYIEMPTIAEDQLAAVDMIYFGSLVQRTANGRRQIQRLMQDKPANAKCFCDINLRPPHVAQDAILACLQLADILKLNSDELEEISRSVGGPPVIEASSTWLMQSYGIDILAITMGDRGSCVVTRHGRLTSPPAHVTTIADTVGAGDAYAAVMAAGILRGMPMDRTLTLATQFAADVCALAGAIPDSQSIYAPVRDQMERMLHGQ